MKSRIKIYADYGVVFSCGFLLLVSQTLLFRGFLTVYQGNELGLAVFFSSWLFWGSVGALLGRFPWPWWERVLNRFSFAPFLFIPAYLLQAVWIARSRELAGIPEYAVFPFLRMIPVAWLGNAPVGLISGLLFSLACAWFSRSEVIPVARVYILEAIGGFVGGVVVTVVLALGLSETGTLLVAVLVAGVSVMPACVLAGKRVVSWLPILIPGLILWAGIHERIDHALDQGQWERVLPGDTLQGRFTTPRGTYLYGEYRGQFQVVAWGTIAETVPNPEYFSEVIALHLAQRPQARRVLVFGPGSFGLCRRLLEVPQMEEVTWLDPDPHYPERLIEVLPEALNPQDSRLHIPHMEIRRFLDPSPELYDLILLNLPDVTTLAMNRFMTVEFLDLLRLHLGPGGMLSVRVSGGENAMGDELVNMGATLYRTLGTIFPSIVLKPGDETWLLGTAGDVSEQAPAVLRDRFASISGVDALYPPEGIPALYPPDRIRFQRDAYLRAIEDDRGDFLLNTDRQPRALLHSLLFAARESGVEQSRAGSLRRFAGGGRGVIPFALALYLILRLVYRHARREPGGAGRFDLYAMIAGAGGVGMALTIILMCLYQYRYGSLFLNVGLVSALYMVGLALGGYGAERWAAESKTSPRKSAPAVAGLHLLLVGAIYVVPGDAAAWVFMGLFLVCGMLGGMYVPLVAAELKRQGTPDRSSGGVLAASDDLGGAVGGMLTGLLILPMFGTFHALWLLGLVLVVVTLPLVVSGRSVPVDAFEAISRPVAYVLFGIAVFSLGSSVWLARSEKPDLPILLGRAAREMAPGEVFEPWGAGDAVVVRGADGYCFSSHNLVEGIGGYGGPVTLAILVDDQAILKAVRVLHSNETPAYLAEVGAWMNSLSGHDLSRPLGEIDGVSGATLTSRAILDTLGAAGRRFAEHTLGIGVSATPGPGRSVDPRVPWFVVFALAALALRRAPTRRHRRLFLLGMAGVCGLYLNLQYSMAQVFALLRFSPPPAGPNLAFVTVVGIPLMVLLAGNVYCGYLCPFGALQELAGHLRPNHVRLDPDRTIWRFARLVKYLLLFVLVMMFAFTLSPDLALVDPLVTLFSGHQKTVAGLLVFSVVGLSVVYRRFWCRNLCPVGAFLSLLNGARLLRRFLPPVAYRACIFGVTGKRDLDCLTCDRCRRMTMHERTALQPPPARTAPWRNGLFATLVLLCALLMLQRASVAWREVSVTPANAAYSSAGTPRDLDLRRVRWLIDQGRLSDHEARYADPVED